MVAWINAEGLSYGKISLPFYVTKERNKKKHSKIKVSKERQI
jgi:hypothetical protein